MTETNENSVLYSFGWEWSHDGGRTSFSIGPYGNIDKGERDFVRALISLDYKPPKWWEARRWGETRLPKRHLLALREQQA